MGRRRKGHRINGKGTLRLDRVFPKPVGRIARVSGTNDQAIFQQIDAMLTALYQQGKSKILLEIRDGVMTPLQVFEKWSRGELDHLHSAAALRPLVSAYTAWSVTRRSSRTGDPVKEGTRKNELSTIKRFVERVGCATIAEVPEALERYREYCKRVGTAREFNGTKTAVSSFITREFRGTKLQADVRAVLNLQETPKRQSPHLSVVEAIAVLQALDADARAVARALLFTGMNRPELWENQWGVVFLKGGQPAVEIRGQKTINRKRHIPLFEEKLYLPAISYDVFRKRLRKVDESLAPGSFRKTFSRWMADAGIPKYRRRDYMGHKFGDITERYEMGEVVGWFKADVDAIHKYIADEQKPKKPQQPDMPSLPVFHFIRPKS